MRAEDRYIQIVGSGGQKTTIFLSDIVSIATLEEGSGSGVGNEPATTAGADDDASSKPAMTSNRGSSQRPAKKGNDAYDDPTPGVFVLPMEGTVGVSFRHDEVLKFVEEVDKYGPGQIIIFEVDSPGGLVTEAEQLERTIADIRKRHRCIAWIEEAISGGCAFSILCPEIYFRTEGTAGSVTAFAGTKAWEGEQLRIWLNKLGDWMEGGGRNRYIAEAMIHAPLMLSYDRDEETGEVEFYNDLSGEHVLSRPGENLTYNSSNAHHSGFADGVADTNEELAELLDLPRWHEKSDAGRKIAADWQRTVERCEAELPRLFAQYQNNRGSTDGREVIGTQIRVLEKLIGWRKRAGIVCDMNGVPPINTLEREIAELRRVLRRFR
ncbi:MAG: hypothetical protein AAF432_16055 [Planctomycetota bacterium]